MNPLWIIGGLVVLSLSKKTASAPSAGAGATSTSDSNPIPEQSDSVIDIVNSDPTTTTTTGSNNLPTGDPAGDLAQVLPGPWFTFSDGFVYRLIRPERQLAPPLFEVALYEKQGDSDHVYGKSADGTHMLGMPK